MGPRFGSGYKKRDAQDDERRCARSLVARQDRPNAHGTEKMKQDEMKTAPGSARLKIGSARLTTGGHERKDVIWWIEERT